MEFDNATNLDRISGVPGIMNDGPKAHICLKSTCYESPESTQDGEKKLQDPDQS